MFDTPADNPFPQPQFGGAPLLAPRQRRARVVALMLGASTFMVYLLCMPGEFQPGIDALHGLLGMNLGVGPAPGNPLYHLYLASANYMLGFLPAATALHASSAACGAVACMLLFGFCREATGLRTESAAHAALLTALSPIIWSTSIICTPEALAWPLVVGLMWMTWRCWTAPRPTRRSAWIGALLSGCLLATLPAAIPVVAVFWLALLGRARTLVHYPGHWIGAVGFALLGLLPFIYYLSRSSSIVVVGSEIMPTTWRDVLDYMAVAPPWLQGSESVASLPAVWRGLSGTAAFLLVSLSVLGALPLLLGILPPAAPIASRSEWLRTWGLLMVVGALATATRCWGLATLTAAGLALVLILRRRLPPILAPVVVLTAMCAAQFLHQSHRITALMPMMVIAALLVARGIDLTKLHAPFMARAVPLVAMLALAVTFGVLVPMRGLAEPPPPVSAMWPTIDEPEIEQYELQQHNVLESLQIITMLLPSDFTSRRFQCVYPRRGYIATQLADLEFELGSLGLSRNLLILDQEILPIFLLFQSTRARFLNYWFVENTQEMRVVFHPLRGQMETYRGIAELVRPHMMRWRVMAMTTTEVPPHAPRGAFFHPLTTVELAGRRLFMWALLPVGI